MKTAPAMDQSDFYISIREDYDRALSRIVLHAINEAAIPLGFNKLVSILSGWSSEFITKHDLQELQAFGQLAGMSSLEILRIIESLIGHGLLSILTSSHFEPPYLKITDSGMDYLRGESNIHIVLNGSTNGRQQAGQTGVDQELLEELKKWRNEITSVNPDYYALADQTLQSLATNKPQSIAALLEVEGLSEEQVNEYGNELLKIIKQERQEEVSYFDHKYVTLYPTVISSLGEKERMLEVLHSFQNGHFKDEVLEAREAFQEDDVIRYNELKRELPVVTFSGTFDGSHKISNLVEYNPVIIADIDNIPEEKLEEIKEKLQADPYLLAMWESVSGRGLKMLFKVDAMEEEHKLMFKALVYYLESKYSLLIDRSGSDIQRPCYVSYDPDIYINPESEAFNFDVAEEHDGDLLERNLEDQGQEIDYPDGQEKQLIREIIKFCREENKSMTYDHEHWYKVCVGLANTFEKEDAKDYYLELCRMDGRFHDEYKSERLFEYCWENKNPYDIRFGTILHYANEMGFEVPELEHDDQSPAN